MMWRLKCVIAGRSTRGHTEMNDGSPALEAVMAGTMEQVGNSDGCRRARRFDPSEERMVVDD